MLNRYSPLEHFFNRNRQDLFLVFNKRIFFPRLEKYVKINKIAIVADLIQIPRSINVMQFNSIEGACLQCHMEPQKIVHGNNYLLFANQP